MSFLSTVLKNPAFAGFLLFTALSTGLASPAIAAEGYDAIYQLEADGMTIGRLERSLEQSTDGSFRLSTETYSTGFWAIFIKDRVNEESRFKLNDTAVIPMSYLYQKKKKGKLTEERVDFDLERTTIFSSSRDGAYELPFSGSESDKLLYQYRIRERLRRGEGAGSELTFAVVDRTQIRPYQFRIGATEKLDTAMGVIEAIRVERINDEKRVTTIWFAPGLDYLPVRIVQDAGDHTYASTIISTTLKR